MTIESKFRKYLDARLIAYVEEEGLFRVKHAAMFADPVAIPPYTRFEAPITILTDYVTIGEGCNFNILDFGRGSVAVTIPEKTVAVQLGMGNNQVKTLPADLIVKVLYLTRSFIEELPEMEGLGKAYVNINRVSTMSIPDSVKLKTVLTLCDACKWALWHHASGLVEIGCKSDNVEGWRQFFALRMFFDTNPYKNKTAYRAIVEAFETIAQAGAEFYPPSNQQ